MLYGLRKRKLSLSLCLWGMCLVYRPSLVNKLMLRVSKPDMNSRRSLAHSIDTSLKYHFYRSVHQITAANALQVKPLRKLEIKNMAKWVPLLPFFWQWIVSDKKYLRIGPPLVGWPVVLLCDWSYIWNQIWAWRAAAITFSFSSFFF